MIVGSFLGLAIDGLFGFLRGLWCLARHSARFSSLVSTEEFKELKSVNRSVVRQ